MSGLAKPMPSQQELQEWFDYRDGDLYWTKSPSRSIKAGMKAGSIYFDKVAMKKSIVIRFKKERYKAHRIVWVWHGNSLESKQDVDHIDGNALNNNINNLRACTSKQNQENRKGANKNSTTGIRGVFLSKNKKIKRWRAEVRHNGKTLHLGTYDTIEEAERVVVSKRKEIFTHSNN